MKEIELAIIKEGKVPPDLRVPLTPNQCVELLKTFPSLSVSVQSSPIRAFKDEDYIHLGVRVEEEVSDADILMGVKEVPVDMLIPNKTYLFFSHTIKEQPHNQKLLQTILSKNIRLIDYECLTDLKGARIIGFGYYAGLVGTYNGIRAWGKRFKTFELKPAIQHPDLDAFRKELQKVELPSIKIALTGAGRVASGVIEILEMLHIQKVSPEDYLVKNYDRPVYTQLRSLDYNKRKDGQKLPSEDFHRNFRDYESDFFKYAEVTDLYITGHFYAEHSPVIISKEDVKKDTFKIKVIADISCDVNEPIACTIRSSTIDNPLYGYHKQNETETTFDDPEGITVMAVDNLPCEIPLISSEGFGKELLKHVIPQFFNGDEGDILKRATIAENGKLTSKYAYLQDYVNGKVAVC